MGVRALITDAFLLHVRPYREQDYWCDLLTVEEGRVRCVLSGRHPEYFRLFQLKLSDRDNWYRASDFRYTGSPLLSDSSAMLYALYVNELCYRALPIGIAQSELLPAYAAVLAQLQYGQSVQQSLRQFEQTLLSVMGMTIDYGVDSVGRPISAEENYNFEPSVGFFCDPIGPLQGSQLVALKHRDYTPRGVLSVARYVHRLQLQVLLDGKAMNSVVWQLGKQSGVTP